MVTLAKIRRIIERNSHGGKPDLLLLDDDIWDELHVIMAGMGIYSIGPHGGLQWRGVEILPKSRGPSVLMVSRQEFKEGGENG